MTRIERSKLAKAARGLAMECVAGTAPAFGTGREFDADGSPCCVMGVAADRAGLAPWPLHIESPIAVAIGNYEAWWAVSNANDGQRDALPWTLLWLADELESRP